MEIEFSERMFREVWADMPKDAKEKYLKWWKEEKAKDDAAEDLICRTRSDIAFVKKHLQDAQGKIAELEKLGEDIERHIRIRRMLERREGLK